MREKRCVGGGVFSDHNTYIRYSIFSIRSVCGVLGKIKRRRRGKGERWQMGERVGVHYRQYCVNCSFNCSLRTYWRWCTSTNEPKHAQKHKQSARNVASGMVATKGGSTLLPSRRYHGAEEPHPTERSTVWAGDSLRV